MVEIGSRCLFSRCLSPLFHFSAPFCVSEKCCDATQARALYNYDTQEEDELTLRAGERLFILGLSQPEWLVAARSGCASNAQAAIGLVPANYVTD